MFYIFLITYKGDVSLYLGGKFCFSHKNPSKEGPTIWLLRRSIGDFRKNNLQTDFEEKNSWKEIPGEKKFPLRKNDLSQPIILKNIITPLYVRKKILSPEVRGQKKFFPKPNNSYHPQRSNGRPLIFGGRCNRYFWDIRLKIVRLPNYIMLFQFLLAKFFKSTLFSCLQKVNHLIN